MSGDKAASQTAVLIAGYRARASDGDDRLCHDPWAARLAGDQGEALCRRWDAHWPAMGLWVALRTRYIDDCVLAALDGGVDQVVLLGAGLDTRAARLRRNGVRFFEVDHPASQADKVARLGRLEGYPEETATLVPCDFEQDDFVAQLADAGLDRARRTCFVWEGVVYYLPEDAARSTLTRLSSEFDPESCVIFDYLNENLVGSNDRLRDEDRAMKGIVEELGEPMRFGINDATPLMSDCGYRFLQTVSYDELALRYTGTYDRSRYFRFQVIALVSASPRPPW
ncbi:MAG: class I SAM-dependent methyltransferase [Myxococcota bacterium]